MRIFISGGAKNGKSMFAQTTAKNLSTENHLWYLATMEPHDDEDYARIERHRNERAGWGFKTAEWGRDIIFKEFEIDCKGTYLVDSVTALLTNEMFGLMEGKPHDFAVERTVNELIFLSDRCENTVFVSDNIYHDAKYYDEWTDFYIRGLAKVDRVLAENSDVVIEFCSGNPIYYKGENLL